MKKKKVRVKKFILNCIPSKNRENDWSFEDATSSNAVNVEATFPKSVDLREGWWKINAQGKTGACVGFAAAYGILHWHYVKAGKIDKDILPSARFIWMANKETDEITNFPTTFLESNGTQTKLALSIARNYGCVSENDLPMKGKLSSLSQAAFYTKAAKLRISSYHNLNSNLDDWRRWLAFQGPILTRLNVDKTWDQASDTDGFLDKFQPDTIRGGHAVCLVGYEKDHFIVRNSWGKDWGDKGFGYASDTYAAVAFTEAYGAVM